MEMTLSLAVIGIIAAFSMPLFLGMQAKNDLDIATNAVVSSMRRAQTLSQAMDGDSTWGVKVQQTPTGRTPPYFARVLLFRGSSYATHATTYDEEFSISEGIVVSGLDEVVFSKLTGDPLQTGTLTLTSGANVRTVTVNSKGTIDY